MSIKQSRFHFLLQDAKYYALGILGTPPPPRTPAASFTPHMIEHFDAIDFSPGFGISTM